MSTIKISAQSKSILLNSGKNHKMNSCKESYNFNSKYSKEKPGETDISYAKIFGNLNPNF